MSDRDLILNSLKRASDQLPDAFDKIEHANQWQLYDDRTVALVLASDIERALGLLIGAKLPGRSYEGDDEKQRSKLDKMDLSRRIRRAEEIRGISATTRDDLEVIRWIRNALAHSRRALTFDTPEVAASVELLTLPARDSGWHYTEFLKPDNAGTRWKFEAICRCYVEKIGNASALFSLHGDNDPPAVR